MSELKRPHDYDYGNLMTELATRMQITDPMLRDQILAGLPTAPIRYIGPPGMVVDDIEREHVKRVTGRDIVVLHIENPERLDF